MASKKVFILLFTLMLTSCSQLEPLKNFNNAPLNTPTHYTLFKVKQHIYAACLKAGWAAENTSDKLIIASFFNKQNQQSGQVEINFNQFNYDILYHDSKQMEFTPDASHPQGLIHKNYNVWVADLQKNIQAVLLDPIDTFLHTLPVELQSYQPTLAGSDLTTSTASLITCSDFPDKILSGQARINRSKANIRTGAGINCTSTGIINSSQTFKLLGQKGNWYQISLENNSTAWIYGSFVHKQP